VPARAPASLARELRGDHPRATRGGGEPTSAALVASPVRRAGRRGSRDREPEGPCSHRGDGQRLPEDRRGRGRQLACGAAPRRGMRDGAGDLARAARSTRGHVPLLFHRPRRHRREAARDRRAPRTARAVGGSQSAARARGDEPPEAFEESRRFRLGPRGDSASFSASSKRSAADSGDSPPPRFVSLYTKANAPSARADRNAAPSRPTSRPPPCLGGPRVARSRARLEPRRPTAWF
jgi:hypothetical protein